MKFLKNTKDSKQKVVLINDPNSNKYELHHFPQEYQDRIEFIDFALNEKELEKEEVILDLLLKVTALGLNVTKLGVAPGYGYVSESAPFWQIIEAYGVKNASGPNSRIIELVGDKTESANMMQEVQDEIENNGEVPGFKKIPQSTSISNRSLDDRANQESLVFDFLWKQVAEGTTSFRFKADNLGGGRGQYKFSLEKDGENYILKNEDDKIIELNISSKESILNLIKSKILDERFYKDQAISGVALQKNLEGTQHFEMQFIVDREGLALFVGGRNCSLQKSGGQKAIELAIADFPGTDKQKEQLIATAKAYFEKIEEKLGEPYIGLATVELLFDPVKQEYYFLEINTRGQVEKTVTDFAQQCDTDSSA